MVNPMWRWIVSSAVVLGSVAIVLQLQLTSSRPDYIALLLFFLVGISVALFFSSVNPSSEHVSVRLLTLRVVRASVALAGVAAATWCLSSAVNRNLLPPLPSQWEYLLLLFATLGVLGFGWRGRKGRAKLHTKFHESKEAGDDLDKNLSTDSPRRSHLQSLKKIRQLVSSQAPHAKIQTLVEEEIARVQMEAKCAILEQEKDILDAPAGFLEWAIQKLPELAQLDLTDLHLGKVVHDINSLHTSEKSIFVDHRRLLAIHPIDRGTANDKCNERAEVAKKAMPIIKANSNRLSEALIQSHEDLSAFESVTGIQVVNIAEPGQPAEYVTFEGNGRREALNRAFGGKQAKEGIEVEVREFGFSDEATKELIRKAVRAMRRIKKVIDN